MRASLEVGLLAVATALLIGVPLGLAAGYFRAADAVISRFTDLLLAFPFLILAVGLAAIRGASLGNAAIAIGIAQIPGVIRVVRSDTLRLKSLDFVAAAVVDGASDLWVLARHVLPNASSVILVQATVAIPAAILGEAVLSFLGLGIQPPAPSLGTMLADGAAVRGAGAVGGDPARPRDHAAGPGVQRVRRQPARRPRPEGEPPMTTRDHGQRRPPTRLAGARRPRPHGLVRDRDRHRLGRRPGRPEPRARRDRRHRRRVRAAARA